MHAWTATEASRALLRAGHGDCLPDAERPRGQQVWEHTVQKEADISAQAAKSLRAGTGGGRGRGRLLRGDPQVQSGGKRPSARAGAGVRSRLPKSLPRRIWPVRARATTRAPVRSCVRAQRLKAAPEQRAGGWVYRRGARGGACLGGCGNVHTALPLLRAPRYCLPNTLPHNLRSTARPAPAPQPPGAVCVPSPARRQRA